MKFLFRRRPALVIGIVGAVIFATNRVAAESPKETTPEVKALAAEIATASDVADRSALIAKAPAESLADHSLQRELIKAAQQWTLGGDYVKAEGLLRFILDLSEKRGDADIAATCEVMIASTLAEFGEVGEALTFVTRAVEYYEKNPTNARAFSSALLGSAIIHLYRSEFSEALRLLDRALTLARSIDYKEGVIPVLNTTGEVYRAEGRPERALRYYDEARRMVGDDHAWNMAFLFNNVGQCYEAMGQIDQAIDYVGRAKEVAEQVKFRPRVATSMAILGNLYLRKNQGDEAERWYRQSLALSRELHEQPSEARALLGLAEVARSRGDAESARVAATEAANIEREIGRHSELASAETTLGRCYLALDRKDEARTAFLDAIAETERVRRQVAGDAVESEAFFANKIAPYREMVALLAADGEQANALEMAERASARALLDMLATGRSETENSVPEPERARRHELSRELAELNHRLKQARDATPPDNGEIARLQAAVTKVRDEREAFEAASVAARNATGRAPSAGEVARADEIAEL
ncbi:MAG TPA: tetratricopeptide repeat protein, partial [Chthoniobacterales bacterium]